MLLQLRSPRQEGILQEALSVLMRQHDSLRLRFWRSQGSWQQAYSEWGDLPFTQMDLSHLAAEDQQMAQKTLATLFQASLRLEQGSLWRVVAFTREKQEQDRLLLICHHLLVDVVSWRILLEDLEHIYSQLVHGQEVHVSAKTSSWQHWASAQERYAQTDPVTKQLTYWQEQLIHPVASLPREGSEGENTIASVAQVSLSLSGEETQALLRDVPQVYHTQINDVLLTALAQTLQQWTAAESWRIGLEGHGREPIHEELDLSRTVGWFTTLYPVVLNLPLGAQADPGQALKAIKEQLRAIPQQGLGYGLLRYLCTQPQVAQQRASWPQGPAAEISFNYLGQFDQGSDEKSHFVLSTDASGLSAEFKKLPAPSARCECSCERWTIACELDV